MLVKKYTSATTAYEKAMGKTSTILCMQSALRHLLGQKAANKGILSLFHFLPIFTPFSTDEAKHDG